MSKLTIKEQFLQEKIVPDFSKDLIAVLDEVFPEHTPLRSEIGIDERVLWMDAGRRELIRSLKQMLEDK